MTPPGPGERAPRTSSLPRLRHGLASHPGRRRLINEDAAAVDARRGLFVVCDGIGGQPSGEAASNLACRALGHWLSRRIRRRRALDPASLQALLTEGVARISAEMHRLAHGRPGLGGMGCTLVAALVDARSVFVVHAGDSRAYLLRGGALRPLTRDHTRMVARSLVAARLRPGVDGEDGEDGERRLLLEYVGSSRPLRPEVRAVPLRPGDRLLLCTDGLSDPLDDAAVAAVLRAEPDPAAASVALVDAANRAGGPDNVTAVVVDYAGPRPVTDADRRGPPRTPERPPAGVTARFHKALLAVEEELGALAADARAVRTPDPLAALAAARSALGETLYRERLEFDGSLADRPAAGFHASRADPAGPWRRAHEARVDDLAPALELVTAGSVRLSPLLPGDDTAELYRRLWRQWRGVERRYFEAFAPAAQGTPGAPAGAADPEAAVVLTGHMFQAVRAMRELLFFLPLFMREGGPSGGGPDAVGGPPGEGVGVRG